FTPTVEVDLCGHATLAAAFVIFNMMNYNGKEILFHSKNSGILKVTQETDILSLDFPSDQITKCEMITEVITGLGTKPEALFRGKSDFMAVLKYEEAVLDLKPKFEELAKLKSRGIIVTAPGLGVDFVSRFFGPQSGINEDPVTGSAHTTLIPYWSERLGKNVLTAKQVSERGGVLYCENKGSRVIIGGKAILYLVGEIYC
nr:PhzF family phenazine biosynthesis protein [Bacteroidota bacterium]